MKKIISIILSMLILSSMCLVSGSVFAGQSVNSVNVKSETELKSRFQFLSARPRTPPPSFSKARLRIISG